MTWILWTLAGLAIAAGAAVGFLLATARTPDVKLVSLRPGRLEAREQSLRVGLRIRNPNPMALPVRAMTYRLWLEEHEIASGASAFSRWIPARGEQTAEVLVTGSARHLARTLPSLALTRQPWRYRLAGTVTPLGTWRLRYEHEGEIDARGILELAKSLR